MANPWVEKCQAYHKAHPELTYKQVLMKLGSGRSHGHSHGHHEKKQKVMIGGRHYLLTQAQRDKAKEVLKTIGEGALEFLPELFA